MTSSRTLRLALCALTVVAAGCASPPDTGSSTSASGPVPPASAPPAGTTPHDGRPASPATPTTPVFPVTGSYQDRQEAELKQELYGSPIRVLRNGDNVKLVVPGNVAFGANSDQIQPGFAATLEDVSAILRKYDKTQIDIRGFTDATGSFEHNQGLSERRAQSIAGFLAGKQITASRLRATGYGPRYPIAPNNSESGRAQNRRIEIELQQR